jgi:outer membrane protein OmpA-like peptidoglycan-associated protein
MKKTIYIVLTLLIAGAATNLSAQTLRGGIVATDVEVTESDGSMILEMVLNVETDAITKLQSMSVTPIITNGDEEARFPYVLVNGWNKRQMYERKLKFENTMLMENLPLDVINLTRKGNESEQYEYIAKVERESWMDKAAMAIEFTLSSPAGVLQRYVSDVAMVETVTEVVKEIEVVKEVPAPPVIVNIEQPKPDTVVVEKVIEKVVEKVVDKDILYLDGAAFLDFETNRSVILPNFRRNPQELQKIDDVLAELRNNTKAEILGLEIIGYASPDGGYANNERLARERALAFTQYIQNRYNIPVEFSNVGSVAEDWKTLRQIVSDSEMAYKSQMLAIIDSTAAPDAKESQLRRLAEGRAWSVLSSTVLPRLRRVEYRVAYRVVE